MFDFSNVVAVCVTELKDHRLYSLMASVQSLFNCVNNLTYLCILNLPNKEEYDEAKRMIEASLSHCSFLGSNKFIIRQGTGSSVAREKMLAFDFISKFDWYLNSDDDVLYSELCLSVLHWAIHKEGYDRFGFCFWDIKEREGVLNYISELLDFDKLSSLLDKYDNKDAPFHHWHNYQRWHCSDPYIIHSVTDKPTAFANSYICKPSVFEPFKEDFLKWEKGVRGYDVHLHCKNQIQSWPWLPAACVIHLGCFDGLINDTWSCHKPVSKEDKRENLEK